MLNLKEVAEYLHLTIEDVQALARRDDIPSQRQGDRLVFPRAAIDAWASRRILGFSESRLADYHARSSARARALSAEGALMAPLINARRIAPRMNSRTKASVMRDMVAIADATDLVADPKELLQLIDERERLCSTALPGGWAILHPRHHDPYMSTESFLILGRTIQPIHFGAEDGAPTDLFFLACCQDDRLHLHTLARLCTMCQQASLLAELRGAETAQEMLASLLHAEAEIVRRL